MDAPGLDDWIVEIMRATFPADMSIEVIPKWDESIFEDNENKNNDQSESAKLKFMSRPF